MLLIPLLTLGQRGGGKGGYGGDYSGFSSKKKSSYFRGNISGKVVDTKTKEALSYAIFRVSNLLRGIKLS